MTTKEKKYRAVELLMKVNQDAVIDKITEILLNNVDSEIEISQELKKELNSRRERHLNGEGNSFSWKEVKDKARKSL